MPAKKLESSFSLWRKAVPRLKRVMKDLDSVRAKLDDDDNAGLLAMVDFDLKANREVRETLQAEMRVRREIIELRKLEMDGMTHDEIEATLIRTAQRRGYRHLDFIRRLLIEQLTPVLGGEAAALAMTDRVCPLPEKMDGYTKRLEKTIGECFDALQKDLDAGVQDIREALEPTAHETTEAIDNIGVADVVPTPINETATATETPERGDN